MSTTIKFSIKDEELAKRVAAARRAIKSHYELKEDDEVDAKFLAFGASRAKALIAYDDSPALKKRLAEQAASKPKKEKKAKVAKPKKAKKTKGAKPKKAKSDASVEEVKIEE